MIYNALAKRMMSDAVTAFQVEAADIPADPQRRTLWNFFAMILFTITVIIAAVSLVLFDYTFQVVKILTIVEDLPDNYDLLSTNDGPVDGTEEEHDEDSTSKRLYIGGDPDGKDKYITSSFRGTLHYLREEAGFFSLWRGFSVNIVYAICASVLNGILRVCFPFTMGKYIAGALVLMIVAPLSLVHTHVILGLPTKETWLSRLARTPYASIVKTLPAMLLLAVTGQATYAFPTLLLKAFMPTLSFDDHPRHENTPYQSMLTPLQCLALYSIFLSSHILLFIPSMIILFRVQASVFPEHEESIIPFERRGAMNVIQAWRTYTWEAKVRIVKLYAKVLPLVWATSLAVGTLIFFELSWALGEKSSVMENILHTWLRNQTGRAP